jgi:hypothetical protein
MKKYFAAAALAACGALASPSVAGAFNPQPDPPGRVAVAIFNYVASPSTAIAANVERPVAP